MCWKLKTHPYLTPCPKVNKWTNDFEIILKAINFIEEDIGKTVQYLTSKNFDDQIISYFINRVETSLSIE